MLLKLGLFIKESILFVSAIALGIFVSWRIYPSLGQGTIEAVHFNSGSLFISMAVIVASLFLLSRFKRVAKISLNIFLILIIFSGFQIVLSAFLSPTAQFLGSIVAVAIFIKIKNVLIHNIAMIFGIAGISSLLGLSISPITAVVILLILSFYDILAVYWTKHMIYMARSMIESGAVFGFVIPFTARGFLTNKKEARMGIGSQFMILGSGDIGLPIIMVSSVVKVSLTHAVLVGLFSIAGLFITHLLFVNQSGRKPMAALPPIAAATILGYLLVQLIS